MVTRSQQEVWRLTPWLAIILCLANFILMAFDARTDGNERVIRIWVQTVADFVQSPVATVASAVTGYFSSYANLRSAQDENTLLRKKVEELELELRQKEELAAENARLVKLLGLKERGKFNVLPARIIGRDPSAWFDSAIIDVGSLDGVKLNMPVVTSGGLVGRVTAVGPLTAQLDLLTREKSGVGAVIGSSELTENSGAVGVVTGTGRSDLLEMKYVPGSIEVTEGQTVYTSGQDKIYPPGLKIGEIIQIEKGSATTPHKIFIKPTGGFESLQEVSVVLYEPKAAPQFEQQAGKPTKSK
jgi:rod shape-determining protein MreC